LLNEQPMGFYPPDSLVHDAQRHGIEILPPDINESKVECHVAPMRAGPSATSYAVRIGLGYVTGVQKHEVDRLLEEREGKGPYGDAGELAARSGASRDTLERLAWAGACEGLARREALWQAGVVAPGRVVPGGIQLSLPIEAPPAPRLRELSGWERLVADYGSTKISIDQHAIGLLRSELPEHVTSSAALERIPHGNEVSVPGVVVARQRPATANGVTFLLLEDEFGTMNLIVPPPVFERYRLIVRSEPFVLAHCKLERRENVTNLLVRSIERIERPDLPRADVRQMEPSAERETGRQQAADLRAVMPAGHNFGRRGR
jgi:error-prone DNA polymerase